MRPLSEEEKASIDLVQVQNLVGKTVTTAIENEMDGNDLEELVDWVLEGNDSGEFFIHEA